MNRPLAAIALSSLLMTGGCANGNNAPPSVQVTALPKQGAIRCARPSAAQRRVLDRDVSAPVGGKGVTLGQLQGKVDELIVDGRAKQRVGRQLARELDRCAMG